MRKIYTQISPFVFRNHENMSDWKKWKYKNSLHPLEKQVLAIIGIKGGMSNL